MPGFPKKLVEEGRAKDSSKSKNTRAFVSTSRQSFKTLLTVGIVPVGGKGKSWI
jgi:hypothetical protein